MKVFKINEFICEFDVLGFDFEGEFKNKEVDFIKDKIVDD